MAYFNLNEYQTVQERIDLLRRNHPTARTTIEILHHTENEIIVRANVFLYLDDDRPTCSDIAHEIKSAKGVNATSHVENAATSSLGRAISQLGGEYSPKGKKPSREEMEKVQRMTKPTPVDTKIVDEFRSVLNTIQTLPELSTLWETVVDAGIADVLRAEFTTKKNSLS